MHGFHKLLSGMAAVALLGAVATMETGAARAQTPAASAPAAGQPAAAAAKPKAKAVKDTAEYDLFNGVLTAVGANDATKALTNLDTWKQKYPESDFKDDRTYYYVLAYAGSKQWAKAVDVAGTLLSRDLATVFTDPKSAPTMTLKLLYATAASIQQIAAPTPEELATGEKAGRMLMDYNAKPEGMADADWAKARGDLQTAARGTLIFVAIKPGADAMAKKDFPAAEEAFSKALQANPDSAQVAYQLGVSQLSQRSKNPAKMSPALYEIARAAAIDPAKSDFATPEARGQVDAYIKKVYVQYHGSEDGLDQLKQQALASPLPPADFHIMSTTEISQQKEAEFEKSNPQLAMWLKIKAALADADGQQYFDTQLKDAAVPKMRGTLVEAKPACKPASLLVAVPLPNAQPPLTAEITLKLDAALAGKPAANTEFQWEGVPTAFVKDPFMLTMDVEKAKLEGLKTEPCTVAPVHHAVPAKKTVPAKKK